MISGDIIKNTELNHPELSKITFKGFPVWLAVRKHWYAKQQKGMYQFNVSTSNVVKSLISTFYGLKHWFKNYDYWFFSSKIVRKNLAGKQTDIFCDYIAKKLQHSWILEYSLDGHYSPKKMYFPNVSSQSLLLLFEKFFGKLILLKYKKKFKALHRQLPVEVEEKMLITDMLKIYMQYLLMKFILNFKKAPKAVFFVSAYTYYGYIKALQEKNVKIVELQHGVIAPSHYGYNYFFDVKKEFFPNILLSFGDLSQHISKDSKFLKYVKILPIGSFVLDYYQNKNSNITYSKYRNKYKKLFCCVLQDCEIGQQFVKEINEIAAQFPDYLFVMIPRRLKSGFYKTIKFNENVFFDEKTNVYEAILNCNYHITAYSTTAIEAPSLGKINLIFNLENKAKRYYSKVLQEGKTTFYFNKKEDFSRILEQANNVRLSEDEIKELNASNFKTGYSQNISTFIATELHCS